MDLEPGVTLSDEEKHWRLDRAAIESEAEMPELAKDAVFAWELYRAGLTCAIGREVAHGDNVDPVIDFMRDAEVQQNMTAFRESGTPVYMGPCAIMEDEVMVVAVSDSQSSSFGFWTPRPDADFKPELINYVRFN